MTRRLLRIGLWSAFIGLVIAAIVLAIVHLPAVQRRAFEEVAHRLQAATGLTIASDGVRLRLLPAGLWMEGVEVSAETGTIARIGRLEAHWSWRELMASPPRLASLDLIEPRIDLSALPPSPEPAEDDGDVEVEQLLAAFELGRLRLVDGSAQATTAGVSLEADGVRVEAGLRAARLAVSAVAERVAATRESRSLVAGPVTVELAGGADGVHLQRVELAGNELAVRLDGTATLAPHAGVELVVVLQADVARLLAWWDPDLAVGGEIAGELHLAGHVGYDEQGVRASFEHQGPSLRVAGYEVDNLTVDYAGGVLDGALAGTGWGRASVSFDRDGVLHATASVEDLDLVRLARGLPVELPIAPPPGAVANGVIEVATALPLEISEIVASARLDLTWIGGSAVLELDASEGAIDVQRIVARLADAELSGRGRLSAARTLNAQLRVAVPDPARPDKALSELLEIPSLGLAGGPAHADVTLAGPLAAPAVHLSAGWDGPAYGELCARRLDLTASSASDDPVVRWEGFLVPIGDGMIHAEGTTERVGFATTAEWQLAVGDLAAASAGFAAVVASGDIRGAVTGGGTASWGDGGWQVAARLLGRGLGSGPWQLETLAVELAADPTAATVTRLQAELAGGSVDGRGRVALTGVEGALDLQLEAAGIDVAQLPLATPEAIAGIVAATATVNGTLGRPELELATTWSGQDAAGPLRSLELQLALADGVAQLSLPRLATAAGSLSGRGSAPLGDLPRSD